jgi:hypothetical protein
VVKSLTGWQGVLKPVCERFANRLGPGGALRHGTADEL